MHFGLRVKTGVPVVPKVATFIKSVQKVATLYKAYVEFFKMNRNYHLKI